MHRIEELLSALTLEEKVSMVAGSGIWHSTPVERLGIPALKMTDGPNGARGDNVSGATAACFPVGSALAASWNVDLVEQVGQALGQEAKTKGAQVLLGPTINIHRTPLGGRNFECYSEDPYLTSRLAVHFTLGVQSEKVSACLKHFICNDSEFERHTISSVVEERPLREIYLAPFEAAVKESSAMSVMSSYNKVNGTYAASHKDLLTGVLKDEWGFQGFVVSDWGGSLETVGNANGGLDMEMPGPARTMGAKLLEAIEAGDVDEVTIDDKVRRILRVLIWSGKMDAPEEVPEQSVDRPEHRALARQAVREAMVLLKNDGVLPLDESKIKTLAVIGPNAKRGQIQGGGSSGVTPHYQCHPLEALEERLSNEVDVVYEPGCLTHKYAPAIDATLLSPPGGQAGDGFAYEIYPAEDFSGPASETGFDASGHISFFGAFANVLQGGAFSARFHTNFRPEITGDYDFGLMSAGLARAYIDESEVVDNWTAQTPGDSFYSFGSTEKRGKFYLEAGKDYQLRVDFLRPATQFVPGIQIGVVPPTPLDLIERAAQAAAKADATVLVVGTNSDWETEGNDRIDMSLPGRQLKLIEAVLKADPKTIIVMNAGSPVDMPWLSKACGLIYTWFPGQEFGHGLSDILFGDFNPSGRLPTSFPVRLEDTPAFASYPGEAGEMHYGEGLFVGYRGYDKRNVAPLFPFGYGLSYSDFSYAELAATQKCRVGDEVIVSIDITNESACEGQEVVQLYIGQVDPSLVRPVKELKGFQKIHLGARESKTVTFLLKPRAFSFWHPDLKDWVCEPGAYDISIGASANDIRQQAKLTLI